MARGNGRKQVGVLLLLGLFVVVLIILSSWSFRADNVIAGSFRLNDIQICEELDDDMKPVSADVPLSGGATQACLWFDYSRAREGDSLEIVWSFGERKIQRDSYRLSESSGVRAFYLMRDDGAPLPAGEYSVAIFCNGRERGVEFFRVDASSGDVWRDYAAPMD
jgi:hypothetical protein